MENLFEIASRKRYRFGSGKGELTTEQLWDLPLQSKSGMDLDTVAKAINAEIKASSEESFVATKTMRTTDLDNKLELVKYVIKVRLAENESARDLVKRQEEASRLKEILAKKLDQRDESLSVEEIKAKLDSLKVGA